MTWFDVLLATVLVLVCLAGVIITVVQLPGTWLILTATFAYGWYDEWRRIDLRTVGMLAAVALIAEIGEATASFWFARKGGASRRAAWYGLAGGIAGALLLSVPIPVVGTLVGGAVGCFIGATLGELQSGKDTVTGARVGVYAAVGRTVGTTLKLAAAVGMAGGVIVAVLFVS